MVMNKFRESIVGKTLLCLGALGTAKVGLEALAQWSDRYISTNTPTQYEQKLASDDASRFPTYLSTLNDFLDTATLDESIAGGQDSVITIKEDYHKTLPIDNPKYPEKIHVDPFGPEVLPDSMEVEPTSGKCPIFTDGLFTDYFFDSKYHTDMLEIFVKDGYEEKKINQFFKDHTNESRVTLYPEDGYLHLKHEKKEADYIMPLSSEAIQKILDL